MSDRELTKLLEKADEPVPEVFHHAMEATLASIAQGEQKGGHRGLPVPRRLWRTIVLVAALMMLTSVAVAAIAHQGVIAAFWGSEAAEGGASLIQRDVATKTVGPYVITVKEAAYDGASLYAMVSIRDTEMTEPLGKPEDYGLRPGYERAADHQVGADIPWPPDTWRVGSYTDGLWVGEEDVPMPGNSIDMAYASGEPGEMLYYHLYRLDTEEVHPTGKVEFTLPYGLRREYWPEEYTIRDEDGRLPVPKEFGISFTLDCDHLPGVEHLEPNLPHTVAGGMEVRCVRADYTPVRAYIKLKCEVPEEALATYTQWAGDGGDYSARDVVWSYAARLKPVDKNGQLLFAADVLENILDGAGESDIWITLPAREEWPEEVYLAPLSESSGLGLMEYSIRIR